MLRIPSPLFPANANLVCCVPRSGKIVDAANKWATFLATLVHDFWRHKAIKSHFVIKSPRFRQFRQFCRLKWTLFVSHAQAVADGPRATDQFAAVAASFVAGLACTAKAVEFGASFLSQLAARLAVATGEEGKGQDR